MKKYFICLSTHAAGFFSGDSKEDAFAEFKKKYAWIKDSAELIESDDDAPIVIQEVIAEYRDKYEYGTARYFNLSIDSTKAIDESTASDILDKAGNISKLANQCEDDLGDLPHDDVVWGVEKLLEQIRQNADAVRNVLNKKSPVGHSMGSKGAED